MNKRGLIAITEILILIIGIIAVNYVLGNEFKLVSAISNLQNPSNKGESPKIPVFEDYYNKIVYKDGKKFVVYHDKLEGTTDLFTEKDGKPGEYIKSIKSVDDLKGYSLEPPIKGDGGPPTKPGIMDFLGGIAIDAGIAAGLAGAILLFGNMVTDDKSKVQAAAAAAGGGFFAGKLTYRLIKQFASPTGWIGKHAGLVSVGVGAAVAIAIFLLMYKKETEEVVYFECYPWDAPVGGENCEKCNKEGILPCSEYQCRSLGQACALLNPGTDEELCTWVHRTDVKPPVIVPWEEALLVDYKYVPDTSISPPDRGVRIVNTQSTSGCAKAFTPISFGVVVDEPAKCKVDYIRKKNFDDMSFFMGGSSLFNYNHSQVLSLPGPGAMNAEAPILQNDGEYELFVKCMDANGNENTGNFVFEFCVEKGPDTTPPMIVTTSVLDGMPVAYNQSSINIEVYVNEPATCKWSPRDQTYDKMENEMQCATSVFEMNAQMLYRCKTTLTGLKNRQDNNFYFRCKDQPLKPERDRNVNQQSYPLTLVGTEPIYISSVGPEGIIKDSTDVVRVELTAKTSAGYKEGEANCYYSDTGADDSYILFYNSGSYEHSQELFLAEGKYKYYIKCIDLGGNSDEKIVEFEVESDSAAPMVVRVYHEDTYLKLITDEKAECVYSKDSCEYSIADGIIIKAVDGTQHYTDWNTNFDYYIKCQDEYGNQPMPNACSIIARPFDIYAGE